MARILVVEDDPLTADVICVELVKHGHAAVCVGDGAEGLERARNEGFDVITLDRLLPTLDGLSLVAKLREANVATPVLMISALSDVDERIAGLRAGGDDYLTKPFAPGEMVTRVEVLLRRVASSTDQASILIGAIHLDLLQRKVTVAGKPVRLLPIEFRLLEFMARNEGKPISRRIIFERVWGYHFDPGANLISVHIARLRKKIDQPGRLSAIVTIKGEGYQLDAV